MHPELLITQLDVRRNFTWVADPSQFGRAEDWRDYTEQVKAGEEWSDDCDAFALTCVNLLWERGIPREDLYLLGCRTEMGVRHLVCGVKESDGVYILDNRYVAVERLEDLPYTWMIYMQASEPGLWRVYQGYLS